MLDAEERRVVRAVADQVADRDVLEFRQDSGGALGERSPGTEHPPIGEEVDPLRRIPAAPPVPHLDEPRPYLLRGRPHRHAARPLEHRVPDDLVPGQRSGCLRIRDAGANAEPARSSSEHPAAQHTRGPGGKRARAIVAPMRKWAHAGPALLCRRWKARCGGRLPTRGGGFRGPCCRSLAH